MLLFCPFVGTRVPPSERLSCRRRSRRHATIAHDVILRSKLLLWVNLESSIADNSLLRGPGFRGACGRIVLHVVHRPPVAYFQSSFRSTCVSTSSSEEIILYRSVRAGGTRCLCGASCDSFWGHVSIPTKSCLAFVFGKGDAWDSGIFSSVCEASRALCFA